MPAVASTLSHPCRGGLFSFCVLACVTGVANCQSTSLALGTTLERELAGAATHEYRIELHAGSYAKILVDQETTDTVVICLDAAGNELFTVNNEAVGFAESGELIADFTGEYRIRIRAADPKAPPGRYRISLDKVEPATPRHRERIAAVRAYAHAMAIYRPTTRENLLAGAASVEEAVGHWGEAGDLGEQAKAVSVAALFYGKLGDRQKSFDFAEQSLALTRKSNDRAAEAAVLTNLGMLYGDFGDRRKAIDYAAQALVLHRELHNRAGEASTLINIGRGYTQTGENRRALEYYDQAMTIAREIQDRARQADLLNNIGSTYSNLGDYPKALQYHQQGLDLVAAAGNETGQAIALNNIATIYWKMGEYQKALDRTLASLAINRARDDRRAMGTNLHNLASTYETMGDHRRALEYYAESISLKRQTGDQWALAGSLNNVGLIYAESGDDRKALEYYAEALVLRRAVGDSEGEAITLHNSGKSYLKLGELQAARDSFEQALAILQKAGNIGRVAASLQSFAEYYARTGDPARAMQTLSEALEISRKVGDRRDEARILADLARLERDRGDFRKAHQRATEALEKFEAVRKSVMSPSLRASFFVSAREAEEIDIESLMALHLEHPEEGFANAALVASERGRARSLLEMLGESAAEIRRGVDGKLLDREWELEQLISGKAEQQVRLLSVKHDAGEASALAKELEALTADLEQVQARIRETSPEYAALTNPAPLTMREIQNQVVDEDTVLLEYALGSRKSFLWAVTPTSLEAFDLPAREEIEAAAKRVYGLLTARNQSPANETPASRAARIRQADARYTEEAAHLSRMLLGPVAARIASKRVMVVGEGALEYLPFAALPDPVVNTDGKRVPLMVHHEVVTAPSASVLAVLRRETSARNPSRGDLAVLADPVFSADDPRVAQNKRTAGAGSPSQFLRLRFSRQEADDIARLAPAGSTLRALDFDASRETVLNPDFGRYRIVHFATHSVLNDQHPELSGVVLSLVDREGRPQNGFLRLYDIYNLRLSAELVVLSACQTALGSELTGEGLMGLTRGFLYAGAPRVVASLWQIDDRTSAEVMKRFYEAMLTRGERPAAALRAAQVGLWNAKGWEAPYYWAAYTLLGEWR